MPAVGSFSVPPSVVACGLLVGLGLNEPLGPTRHCPAKAQSEVETHRPLAERGDAEAQVRLGNALLDRAGGGRAMSDPKDVAEAAQWFRRAAEQGHAEAQRAFGLMLAGGYGIDRDDAAAVRWFQLAADQGLAEGQFSLGMMYARGNGVHQDDVEAGRWVRLAAAQGLVEAQAFLAMMYAEGRGMPQDFVAAHMWYSVAQAQDAAGNHAGPAIRYSDELEAISAGMTPAQIAEAERLAREWQPTPQL